MFNQQPNISPEAWAIVGISPRSRWSNRDDSSYRSNERSKKWKPLTHDWGRTRGESSAPIFLVGQIASVASFAMLYAGFEQSQAESADMVQGWTLGGPALFVTVIFSLISFLCLFRVAISGKAPRRRRRLARLWLLGAIIAVLTLSQ